MSDDVDDEGEEFDDEAVERIADLLRSEDEAVRLQGRELAQTHSIEALDFLMFILRGESSRDFSPEFLTVRLISLRKRLDLAARPRPSG